MIFSANMFLQYVGESSLAIAYFVSGYVTKVKRSNMQNMWEEVSSHSSIYSKRWSFGICSLCSRECGLYDLLLGDHLWYEYKEREKSILPNHTMYHPSKDNECESYYYSLLLLFIPFL